MTNLELVRQKCIEANPEIAGRCFDCGCLNDGDNCSTGGVHSEPRPIHLADVLLAIGDRGLASMSISPVTIDYGKVSFIWEPYGQSGHFMWNLKDDDLTHQSQETVDFLAEILR